MNPKRKKEKLTVVLWLWLLPLFASQAPIEGRVVDEETKEPLPYTNITVLGKYKGTVANGEGHFVLDLEGVAPTDTVLFVFMGYETFRIISSDLARLSVIPMHPVEVKLLEVPVLSRSLTAKQIIALVEENFARNYYSAPTNERIYCHKYTRFPMKKGNKVEIKKSDFAGLNKNSFNGILKRLPAEFTAYQDAIMELYSRGNEHKLIPKQAISLEEGSQQVLMKELESQMEGFLADFEKTKANKDQYYKVRTGILSHKINSEESDWNTYKEDTANYTIETDLIKSEVLFLYDNYAELESKNWEFVTSPSKYEYKLEETTILNNELVYKISFNPTKRGLFQGTLYVSTGTYAVLQLDFAYANGKQTEKFQLLGVGHAMNFKGGHVIFEKGRQGYFVKYLSAQQNESVRLDRDFSIVKKQKRLFVDKELNELQLQVEVAFDVESSWELLLLDREEIEASQFDKATQPDWMKFKKVYGYTPDMWGNSTILVPTSELKKYKRK
jgi:hypothetical protein